MDGNSAKIKEEQIAKLNTNTVLQMRDAGIGFETI
jgi:hypothetical protein